MSIVINKSTKVIVAGITGHQGSFHTKMMKQYGTNIVAGVTPGKGGQEVEGIPVYNSFKKALIKHKANWAIVFVPALHTKESVLESLKNNLNVVVITEEIPEHDSLEFIQEAKKRNKILIGPNCPGLLSVGESKLGIMPNHIFKKGKIGIISRSGTLTYEITHLLSINGIGQSTVVGIGGDKVIGFNYIEALKQFEKDSNTKKIVLIGEIGGNLEEETAKYLSKRKHKEIIAYFVGRSAPKGKQMGHAGAVVFGNSGTFESKRKAFESIGIKVTDVPSQIVKFIKK